MINYLKTAKFSLQKLIFNIKRQNDFCFDNRTDRTAQHVFCTSKAATYQIKMAYQECVHSDACNISKEEKNILMYSVMERIVRSLSKVDGRRRRHRK